MLTLSRFMSSSYDVRRRPGVDRSLIKIVDFLSKDDGNMIVFRVISQSDMKKGYDARILIVDRQITPMSNVKFHCTCPSFKFQFETTLSIHDALIGQATNPKLPKKQVIHVCKHLEGCLKFLLTFKNLSFIESKFKDQSGV
jgi:hypothetical protein